MRLANVPGVAKDTGLRLAAVISPRLGLPSGGASENLPILGAFQID